MSSWRTDAVLRDTLLWIFFLTTALHYNPSYSLTSLAKNDPYPMYSSLDPQTFLATKERLEIKDPPYAMYKREDWGVAISPFGENANAGANLYGAHYLPFIETGNTGAPGIPIELGDITGRINMLALIYGPTPTGQTLPPALVTAKETLFPNQTTPIDNATYIDPQQEYASFTAPMKYRKRGIRLDLYKKAWCNFGLNIQTGVASITQTAVLKDLTCGATANCPFVLPATEFTANVESLLMSPVNTILDQLKRSLPTCTETSIEELRINAYWRNQFECNEDRNLWPHTVIMPWIEAGVSVSPGRKMCTHQVFDAAFGNNGHTAMGISAGLNVDFLDTIEVGVEAGATYFFARSVEDLPIPNSIFQKTLFPFTADAKVYPGYNWNFGVKCSSYHFIDNLSLYFEYIIVNHACDRIKQIDCHGKPYNDPAFLPCVLEKQTGFRSRMANVALNYDLAPNVMVGILWQAPSSQRNSYQTSTVLLTLYFTF